MFSCFIGTISSLIYNPKIGHGPDSKREMYFICTKLDNGWGDYGLDIINKGLKNKNQEQNEQGSLLIRWIPNLEKYVSFRHYTTSPRWPLKLDRCPSQSIKAASTSVALPTKEKFLPPPA